MAHMSKDAALTKAFLEGADVHSVTASEIFTTNLEKINAEQRRTAKVINFGLIYGMGAFGLSKSLGISRMLLTTILIVTFSGTRSRVFYARDKS